MQVLARRIRSESYTVDYAGIWMRLAALLVDIVILVLVSRLYNGLWGLATGAGFWGGEAVDPAMPDGVVGYTSYSWAISGAIFFLIFVAYFIGFWGWRGQTPGKMLFKIRIVRFDGSHIGWSGAAMRFLGYIISALLALTGFLWVAFDSRHQGFHDKIADTFVVRAATAPSPPAGR